MAHGVYSKIAWFLFLHKPTHVHTTRVLQSFDLSLMFSPDPVGLAEIKYKYLFKLKKKKDLLMLMLKRYKAIHIERLIFVLVGCHQDQAYAEILLPFQCALRT